MSEQSKNEGELSATRRLYATTPLHGAIVTGDAINCEQKSATWVEENGADYIFQLKENQPNALKHAMNLAAKLPPPILPTNQPRIRSPVF